ncbi:arginase family protein [Oceanispirochaeta crateris]|uniref:Arginase family protein n=1 Tax=Oceanispirochaeta crateris TaxID=2518645 RepID=A0A5C1QHW9_9SPIO|nr:arginase family protein [Oceanispirochaeta crateris]QEN06709.1 arginase family protein [Oceanispirochaeta crateris]
MDKQYIFAPQWQDSGHTNELYDGALALKQYFQTLSNEEIQEIQIKDHQSEKTENNVLGYSIIEDQLLEIDSLLRSHQSKKVMAIGGGCGIEVPIVSYLSERYEDLQLFWFDAHGDLNSPQTSPSKYFHGMPLRFITERQKNTIGQRYNTVPTQNVHLVGVRDLDAPEGEYMTKHKMDFIPIDHMILKSLHASLQAEKTAYIHIDLDVLDPSEYQNVKCPVKNGLKISQLLELIKTIKENMNIVGISILENTETNMDSIAKLKQIMEEMIAL